MLTKLVNGERVEMSPEEEAAFVAAQEARQNAAPPIPQIVSRFQARAALLQAGLLDQVEQAVVAANDPFITLAWAETLEWRRDSPTLNALASGLGLTGEQIDDLFRTAATITA